MHEHTCMIMHAILDPKHDYDHKITVFLNTLLFHMEDNQPMIIRGLFRSNIGIILYTSKYVQILTKSKYVLENLTITHQDVTLSVQKS